jgi:hypothetical protein
MTLGLIILLGACSGEGDDDGDAADDRAAASARPPATTLDPNAETATTIGAVPIRPDDQSAPSLTPGPTIDPPTGASPAPAPAPGGAPPLTSGIADVLIAQGYSPSRAACVAAAVLEQFRGEELTIAVDYLADPANRSAGAVGPALQTLVAGCPA